MVGHEDDGGLHPGESEERAKHHVVVKVSSFQTVLKNTEIPVVDVVLFWRMIPHEGVAEVVDRVVINSHEVPPLVLNEPSRGRMNGCTIGNNLEKPLHAR